MKRILKDHGYLGKLYYEEKVAVHQELWPWNGFEILAVSLNLLVLVDVWLMANVDWFYGILVFYSYFFYVVFLVPKEKETGAYPVEKCTVERCLNIANERRNFDLLLS